MNDWGKDYLAHHGIKGMKWGVRRYQNEDGSLTTAGKKHYSAKEADGKASRKEWADRFTSPTIKGGKDKPNISPAEKTAKELGKVVDESDRVLDAADRIRRRHKSSDSDISKMSDDEIRKRINRMNLERQYSDLTYGDTNKGFETVKDVLSIVGSTVAIVGGVVTIYSTLKHV